MAEVRQMWIAALYRSHGGSFRLAAKEAALTPAEIEAWERGDPAWEALVSSLDHVLVRKVLDEVLRDLQTDVASRPRVYRTIGALLEEATTGSEPVGGASTVGRQPKPPSDAPTGRAAAVADD